MKEIAAVVEKYDVGALVVLHLPGHSEWMTKLNPSYSCARFTDGGIRIRAKAEDFGGDTKQRDQKLTDTANMLMHLSTIGGEQALIIGQVSKAVDKLLEADHGDGQHTSETDQNN